MSNDSEGKKLSELRVVDLRSELEKRSLEKTGIKAQLIERLVKALKDEGHDPETYEFKGVSKRLTTTARAESESDVSTMAEDAADKQDQDEEMSDDHKKENNDEKLKADVNGTETEDSLNLTIEDDEDQLLNESNDEILQSAEKTNGSDLNKSQPNEDEEHKDEEADLVENRKVKSTDIITEDKDATSEREDSSATVPEPPTATTGGDSSINEEPTSGEVQAETGGGEVNSTSGGTAEADSANTSTSLKIEKDANSGRSLWISRLSTLTRATDLKHLFSKYGKVVGAKVVTNARTPSARCYGYVIMATTADAENCIKRVHKTELHGRFISVEKARSDKNDTANKEPRKFDNDKLDEKNEKKGPIIDEKNKPKDIKEKDVSKDEVKEKEKSSSDIDRKIIDRKARNEKNSKSRDREPDRRERHRSAGSGRSGKERSKKKDETSNEREREREKERDRGERDRDRSRLRRRSSERDRTRRNDVLTFKQILEERGRQRQRERERIRRETENRKRELERIEIERRKVEQTKLLIKEQDRLRIERERLQRAKRETQQVLREVERMKRDIERKKVERDESLKKQREHQLAKEDLLRIERERLEMERLELKRQQMHLVEQARHATKRPADDRRDVYTDDRKRVATSSSSSHRFEAPPVPHYDVPSSPAPPGIISKKHDNYKSHESRNDYKMRDDFRSRDDVKTRDDYKPRDDYSKRDDYKRDRGDFAPPPPMLSGPSSHSSMPVKYSGPDSPYAGNVRAPSRDVRRDVIPSNVRGSASSKDLRYSDRSGGPVDRSPPSAPSYRESDHRSSKSDIRSSRDHRYSDSSMKDSSHYSERDSGGWHSGPSPIKPFGAQSSGGSGRDSWLKNENESMGGGGWSNTSSGHPQNSARWVNSPSSRLMSGSGGAYGGNSAGSSGGLAPPGVSGSSYAADQRYESYKSSMGSSLRKY